jgi:hypothetical protein
MYFASDKCNEHYFIEALISQVNARPNLHWMALVDGAFDFGEKPLPGFAHRHGLYDNDEMRDLVEASPFLVNLSIENTEVLQSEISSLVRHRKNRPMLSFIASEKKAPEIISGWQRLTNVTTEDGQKFLLRFADTRVTPVLAEILQPASWAALTELLDSWLYIDRSGLLAELPMKSAGIQPVLPLILSDKELSALIAHNQPDAIIAEFAERRTELLPDARHAAFYDRIERACALAKTCEVEAFPDLVALATLTCVTEEAALNNPHLIHLLKEKQYESGNLINALMTFV